MLAADRDRTGDGERQRAARSDGPVEDGINAAKECSSERGEAVSKKLIQRFYFIDSADANFLVHLDLILLKLPAETF